MRFGGVSTLQQVIDEVTREVWTRRHPDRPQPAGYTEFGGDPELNAIQNLVREAVLRVAEEEATPVPPIDAEWQEQQRLARIGEMAFVAQMRTERLGP